MAKKWFYFSRKERWAILTIVFVILILGSIRWFVMPHMSYPTHDIKTHQIDSAIARFELELKQKPDKKTVRGQKKASTPTPPPVQRIGNVNDISVPE